MFTAILLDKNGDDTTTAQLAQLDDAQLPADGDVTVRVDYSTMNYKDGLAIAGKAPVVRSWPMVPGIDGAGVKSSFPLGSKGWDVTSSVKRYMSSPSRCPSRVSSAGLSRSWFS